MKEITELAIEIIKDLIKLSVPEINVIRKNWMVALCNAEQEYNYVFFEKFVNFTCDYAIKKVMREIV